MIKQKAKSAVLWSGLDAFFRQGIAIFIAIILARLLLPEDFGTIALLSLFVGLANLFVDAGFSAALIQRQDVTRTDESTVFWFNVIIAFLCAILLIVIAPWFAVFFDLPVLNPLMKVMACSVVIASLGSIHGTLLTKKLEFKTLMKIGLISTSASGIVAIYLASEGYGVWALAAQTLLASLLRSSCLWLYNPWRPMFVFSRDSFRSLFGFSGFIFAAALLQVIYERGYSVLIGKFFGVRDLGFYHRAESTYSMSSNFLSGIVSRVAFPLYSSIAHDTERLRRAAKVAVQITMLISIPIMIVLATVADSLIPLVFGERWLPSVPIFQVLCLAGLFFPLHVMNVSLLKAQGRADLNFRLNVVKKITGIVFLGIGSFYGIIGVAWGCVCQSIIALVINGYYSNKILGYGTIEQIRDCLPSLINGSLIVLPIMMLRNQLDLSDVLELLASIIVGVVIYFLLNFIFKVHAFNEAIRFIKNDNKGG